LATGIIYPRKKEREKYISLLLKTKMETIIWIQIVKEIVTKKKKLRRLHHKKMVNEIKKNKLFKRIKNG